MDQSHAFQRLSHHANAAEDDIFTFALWQAARQRHQPELGSVFDDVLSCFDTINLALNTQRPSETLQGKAEVLPRSLVADVSSILSDGWSYYRRWASSGQFTPQFQAEFAAMLVQIGIAWDAVLAGDINDIRKHVQTEYSVREYDAA